jgi:hypothetical protein
MRMKPFLCVAALISTSFASLAMAQDPRDEMYGQAVHSYFRGDLDHAEMLLNEAIGAGSTDPRAHFFRGLCQSRNGVDAGLADFERGAQLEIDGARRSVNVGQALQRIQGHARIEIEKARLKARLAARATNQEMRPLGNSNAQSGIVVPPKGGDPAPRPNALAPNDPFNSGMTKGDPKGVDGAKTKPPVDDFDAEMADPAGDAMPDAASDDPFK